MVTRPRTGRPLLEGVRVECPQSITPASVRPDGPDANPLIPGRPSRPEGSPHSSLPPGRPWAGRPQTSQEPPPAKAFASCF
jgi:hypothetical protein